jgi:hypothetical protein
MISTVGSRPRAEALKSPSAGQGGWCRSALFAFVEVVMEDDTFFAVLGDPSARSADRFTLLAPYDTFGREPRLDMVQ